MARYGLENDTIRIEIDSHGAELKSLVKKETDHVKAWVNGGATDESNCQMLCKTHNRSKGNR